MFFKISSAIIYAFLTSFYQRVGANSPLKNFDDDLNLQVLYVHGFNIFAHFVEKN